MHRAKQQRVCWRSLAYALTTLLVVGCAAPLQITSGEQERLRVTATTTIVADLVQVIGGERVAVRALMGPGVDPHLYKPSISDVLYLGEADAVFYLGIHLEGRMADLFENMRRAGRHTYAVSSALPETTLLMNDEGTPDPHIWFDVPLWGIAAQGVAEELSRLDPAGAEEYQRRLEDYLVALERLDAWAQAELARIPPEARVLVTAHDAFGYFGRRYGVEVHALQGINTTAEIGARDVQQLAAFLAERRVPAIFVETSVSSATLEAVRQAARARGWDVRFGEPLFSDALGEAHSPTGTYVGMVEHNVNAIVSALSTVGETQP